MSSDSAFLDASASIAHGIVADAVWHDGRCNWTGAVVDPAVPWRFEVRALEPDLYDGAAGVGLFLAQLAAVTGDAAVLYLSGERFLALRETLCDVASALSAHLPARIPAFTLELAPGVGVAEADGTGESFGIRRCGLLAEAIVLAHEQRITDAGARVDAVAARFAEDGLQIDAPYLEPSLAGRHVL